MKTLPLEGTELGPVPREGDTEKMLPELGFEEYTKFVEVILREGQGPHRGLDIGGSRRTTQTIKQD